VTAATGPFAADPMLVRSVADGTELAVFELVAPGSPGRPGPREPASKPARPPLLLVHGATADHTTWRAVGPRFAASRRVFAMDRRGRGASGDSADYSIDMEFDDVASVARAIAEGGGTVDIAGHSYGGRCALGASLRAPVIRRLVVYEGAPVPPGMSYRPPGMVDAVREALARGDKDAALSTFLSGIVGMSEAGLAAYRTEPVWPARVAAAHTILREIEAEATPAASLDGLAAVSVPVLLLLGSISRSPFRIGTDALAARLAKAQVRVIDGAAHAAHHTHVDEFVGLVEAFLDAPLDTDRRIGA
jgi:pimeloyl-ACP methyl ester carboxylesterase